MKDYENLDEELKQQIQEICDYDSYGSLSPETLYRNIYHSSGSYIELAKIFDVVPSLVRSIKEN